MAAQDIASWRSVGLDHLGGGFHVPSTRAFVAAQDIASWRSVGLDHLGGGLDGGRTVTSTAS